MKKGCHADRPVPNRAMNELPVSGSTAGGLTHPVVDVLTGTTLIPTYRSKCRSLRTLKLRWP